MQASLKKHLKNSEYFFDEGCFITELSNSESDPELSIAKARVEPGKTTKWHFLKGLTERYVILEGTGRVEVSTLEPQIVNTGDVVLIPPLAHQRITNIGNNDLIFLAICSPRFTESAYVDAST